MHGETIILQKLYVGSNLLIFVFDGNEKFHFHFKESIQLYSNLFIDNGKFN